MKKLFLVFLPLLPIFTGNVSANEVYPSLLEVEVGKPFAHPRGTERKDIGRPTTQFKVPNYGRLHTLFPEFSVSYLNSSNAIAIVTADKVHPDTKSCQSSKTKLQEILKELFPNHRLVSQQDSPLRSTSEYLDPGNNMYYSLNCRGSYGPFWSLHLQFRGLEEDELLKKAWGEYFNKS
jgi:hypothetical protein